MQATIVTMCVCGNYTNSNNNNTYFFYDYNVVFVSSI